MVGISLFREDNVDHFGIGDILAAVVRNVLLEDELECVGAFEKLPYVGGVGADALAEATKFVGV